MLPLWISQLYRALLLALLAGWLVTAGANTPNTSAIRFTGAPPIARFTPDIDFLPTNYCIARDSRGIVFICNTQGVLEFDGERWRLHPLPNAEIVRRIVIDRDDTVYVGGYNSFGILHREPTGQRRYEDLTPLFKEELKGKAFDDVWAILIAPEGIYFKSLRDLFFVQRTNGVITTKRYWRHEGRFGLITRHEDKTLVHFRGDAIRYRDGDRWIELPGSQAIRSAVFMSLPLKQGGLLIFGYAQGWWRIFNGTVTPHPGPPDIAEQSQIAHAIQLNNGHSVFSMINGGMRIYDDLGQPNIASFQVDSGYLHGATQHQHGGFLTASDTALYHISWPTRWSTLNLEDNRGGTLQNVRKWGDRTLVIGEGGVYRVSTSAGPSTLVPWLEGSSHDMLPLTERYALLSSGTHNLWLFDASKLSSGSTNSIQRTTTQIGDDKVYPRVFLQSAFVPTRVLLATEFGLRIVETSNIAQGKVTLSDAQPTGMSMRVNSFIERSAQEVWCGSVRNGAWRITITDGKPTAAYRFSEADGIEYGVVPEAQLFQSPDGTVYASTTKGTYRWDSTKNKFVSDALNGLEALIASTVEPQRRQPFTVAYAPNGDRWAYDSMRLWRQPKGGTWGSMELGRLRRGILQSHQFDAQQRFFLLSSYGLLAYQHQGEELSSAGKTPEQSHAQVQLRAVVKIAPDGTRTYWPVDSTTPVQVPKSDFSLRFEFALPDYSGEASRRYKGQLIGHDSITGDWATARAYTYGSLTAGKYRLELQGRDGQGNVSQIAPYTFIVTPPWWETHWARLFAGLIALAGLGGVVRWAVHRRTQLLEEENIKLEQKVTARTQELAQANQQLDQMAHVDGLTGLANRRALDNAINTEWPKAKAARTPISVLLIDVDHFKRYNDTHGHLAGDEILKGVASTLKPCLHRPQDVLTRYGGEEFIVLMPGASPEVAQRTAQAMCDAVANSTLGVTISIGVATYPAGPEQLDETAVQVIERADHALYAAKNGGRNRVMCMVKI